MIISLKGQGMDFNSVGHPLSWYEGAKAKNFDWVALDMMTSGFEADVKLALQSGLAVILFQGYWEPAWADPAEAQNRANFAVNAAKSAGYEMGAPIVLDFESVSVDQSSAMAWCRAWCEVVSNAGFVPAIYVGVPQPLSSDDLYALPFQHYWKSCSADTVDVATRGYQIIQSACGQNLDGLDVDLDKADADQLGDFMMAMFESVTRTSATEPAAMPSQKRTLWVVSSGQTLDYIARQVRVPMPVLARYNHIANPNVISVGESLSIPMEIRVKSGQTLSGIVDGLHDPSLSWPFVADVNQINPDRLWVGQSIWV